MHDATLHILSMTDPLLFLNLLAQKISEASKVNYLSKAKSSSFQYFGPPIGTVYIITPRGPGAKFSTKFSSSTSMSNAWSNVY
jgi:hypothetical protein